MACFYRHDPEEGTARGLYLQVLAAEPGALAVRATLADIAAAVLAAEALEDSAAAALGAAVHPVDFNKQKVYTIH